MPRLGLFSGTMMVVGGIIGSGIFLNPALVAQRVRTAGLTLAVWVLGGVIALIGALVFAELGARRPVAGGGYVYLRDAYGRLPAFLYAWTLLLVIATGAIAAVAVTFASYTAALARAGDPAARVPLAVGAIVLLSAVNYVGVKPGAVTQNVLHRCSSWARSRPVVARAAAAAPDRLRAARRPRSVAGGRGAGGRGRPGAGAVCLSAAGSRPTSWRRS